MKIESFKKLKGNQYKLKLETGAKIITYDNVILNNNLLFNKNIDGDIIHKIERENIYYDLYNKILKMVSTRLRSEKEIREYLKKNNLFDKEIEDMIIDLKNKQIINDTNFIKAFIHDKIYFTSYGPKKIKKLALDYVSEDIIDKELATVDSNIFEEKKKKIIAKKASINHKYSNTILKKKIIDELKMQGFEDTDFIEPIEDDTTILEKECLKQYNKLVKKYNGNTLRLKLQQKLYQKGFNADLISSVIDGLINKS